jgi:hypothetical protein
VLLSESGEGRATTPAIDVERAELLLFNVKPPNGGWGACCLAACFTSNSSNEIEVVLEPVSRMPPACRAFTFNLPCFAIVGMVFLSASALWPLCWGGKEEELPHWESSRQGYLLVENPLVLALHRLQSQHSHGAFLILLVFQASAGRQQHSSNV